MNHHDRIVRDPAICAGQPVIKGTRVLVRVILGYLAHGETTEAILRDFPSLTAEDVRAVIAFAAAAAGEDLPAPTPLPSEIKSRMKLKLDENLPVTLATRLRERGYDVDTVLDEELGGLPDETVWQAAQAESRLLVTQDLDFSDTRKFVPGTHHGILLVRLPDAEQWRVSDFVVGWLSDPESPSWARCVIVATPNKVRVIRPPVPNE